MREYENFNTNKCIICGNEQSRIEKSGDFLGLSYYCPNCGDYRITRNALITIENDFDLLNEFKDKAPSLAFERNINGLTPFTIILEDKIIKVAGADFLAQYPTDFEERMNRSLLMLYKQNAPYSQRELNPRDSHYFFAQGDNDNIAASIFSAINELDYISIIQQFQSGTNFQLNIAGYKYVKELSKELDKKETCFIAMWFSDEHTKLYREATKTAIELAGYQPVIIDETMHNDFIMNRILNAIKEARFVIADFTSIKESDLKTGVRGGVYYEAGYAEGLGLEVIHTCREDAFESGRRHFDIQQKSTIVWHEDNKQIKTRTSDYIEYLKEHIIATVGKGPKYNDQQL